MSARDVVPMDAGALSNAVVATEKGALFPAEKQFTTPVVRYTVVTIAVFAVAAGLFGLLQWIPLPSLAVCTQKWAKEERGRD